MALLAAVFSGTGEGHIWTLEECIRYALVHNPEIRQAEITARKCRTEAAASLSEWLPEVNVYAGNNLSWGRSVDMQELLIVNNRLNYTASVSATARVPVTDYLSLAVRNKELRLAEAESKAGYRATAASLTSDVTSSFYQWLLSTEALRIVESEYDDLMIKRRLAEDEVAAGMKPQIDIIRMDSRLAEEKAALREAVNNVELNRRTLISYLNLPPEEVIAIRPPAEDSLYPPYGLYEQILQKLSENPEVRRAVIALERSKSVLKAAKRSFLPDIGITLGYGTYYGNASSIPLGKQLSSNHNPSVEIGLSVPLTGYFRKVKSLKTAELEVAGREVEVEKARQELHRAVFNDVSQAINLYETLIASREILAAVGEEYSLNLVRMEGGEISWSDFILSRNSMQRAEIDAIQAKYRYLVKIKELQFRYDI